MFETLKPADPDPIIALIGAFRDDPRPGKIDLGVGVYRDENGRTPVLRAIREAERRLVETQESKSYLGLDGDPDFVAAAAKLVLGDALAARATGVQAVGGSGALFVLGRLTARARPDAAARMPDPTWANHYNLLGAAGLATGRYPYVDAETRALRFDRMAEALDRFGPGDVVVLHGCCHNPTGADPDAAQWREIAAIAARRGWTPLIDLAYLGFGDGPEADASGMRAVLEAVPEAMVAFSFSKSMGLYRDRTGVALVVSSDPNAARAAHGTLSAVNRETFSMPPDHGAAAARIVLEDAALRADWLAELEVMRARVAANRRRLAEALAARPGGQGWTFLGDRKGMFSLLGLTDAQCAALRDEHAVYVAPGGRINLAGLAEADVERFADALLAVA